VTSAEYIRNSTTWLRRVKAHMSSRGPGEGEASPASAADQLADLEYLSRFEFTRTCVDGSSSSTGSGGGGGGVSEVTKWTEWIEPLGIPARHPFGFGRCRPAAPYYGPQTPRTGRSDVDYVLLQSGAALHRHTHTAQGRRFRPAAPISSSPAPAAVKHFLFDAGTSTFDSGLFWFTCAYSQVSKYCKVAKVA
jgi:hypothetical protein